MSQSLQRAAMEATRAVEKNDDLKEGLHEADAILEKAMFELKGSAAHAVIGRLRWRVMKAKDKKEAMMLIAEASFIGG